MLERVETRVPEAHRPDGRRRGLRRPLVRPDQDRAPPTPSATSKRPGHDAARSAGAAGKRTARQARKVPGVAQAEGQIKGAVAGENDLAIAGYDSLTADEIVSRLPSLSQVDLAKIDSYERRNQDRSTVLGRLSALRGTEPWPGYDELTVSDIQVVLANADDDLVSRGPRLRALA